MKDPTDEALNDSLCGRALRGLRDLGPCWQLSMSDVAGWEDSRRWWCWLPEENGGDGKVYASWTPLGAVEAATTEDEERVLKG